MTPEQAHEMGRCIFREANDAFFVIHPSDLRVVDVNPSAQRLSGLRKKKLLQLKIDDLVESAPGRDIAELLRACQSTACCVSTDGYYLKTARGGRKAVHVSVSRIHTDPEPFGLLVVRDISRQKEAEQSLAETTSELQAVFQAFPDLYFWIDRDGTLVRHHAGRTSDLYMPSESFLGKKVQDVLPPPVGRQILQATVQAIEAGALVNIEYSLPMPEGEKFFEARLLPIREHQVLAIVRNITDQKRLKEQFLQSQKLEAIGRLAGGIAHDFNNLLTVIIGFSDLLLGSQLKERDDARECITEIKNAGEQAASLTRQLLAFSRRLTLAPEVLSINSIVTKMESMLRRLLGENIRLTIVLSPDTNLVKVDAGQIQQVVLNLAINARDAMPTGGSVTIETCNVDVEGIPGHELAAIQAGSYVRLAVSDTGCGMDEQTKARVFEPFFTTKAIGRGTGLGLATIYGIIEQSGGHITVQSKVGEGTTFHIYLPRWIGPQRSDEARSKSAELPGGSETILLVEDDPAIRALVARVLRRCGYTVLEAENGAIAFHIAAEHSGQIHLLLTDVIMPTMGGRELVDRLLPTHPKMKALYISGYSAEEIGNHDVLDPTTPLLQKPFTSVPLARTVREILDKP